jgi:hypothetical protein
MPAQRKRRKPAVDSGSDDEDAEETLATLQSSMERRVKPAGVSAESLLQGAALQPGHAERLLLQLSTYPRGGTIESGFLIYMNTLEPQFCAVSNRESLHGVLTRRRPSRVLQDSQRLGGLS